MIFRVSTTSERLVGRLDAGEDLVEVVTNICADHEVEAGEVRAVGHFDAIELVHFNTTEQRYEPLVDGEGDFELVSLNGNVSRLGGEVALRLDAVFNVVGPVGPQMIGGQLRYARAVGAEFVVETFADLRMERRLDNETGQLVLDSIERRAGASKSTSGTAVSTQESPQKQTGGDEGSSMSWDEAIAEAEQTEQVREKRRSTGPAASTTRSDKGSDDPYANFDFDEPLLSRGDLLDHEKLGKCRILDVEEDQYVKIKMPRGRIRKLALAVLDVEYRGKEDGKRVFDARVKR